MKVRLRDRSGIRLYRYVVEDVDRHGNVRIYFRRKGQGKIRLIEVPGTVAFDAEYQRAFSGALKPPTNRNNAAMPGTMHWLCQQYFESAAFQSLAPSTRKVRRGILEEICERADVAKLNASMQQELAGKGLIFNQPMTAPFRDKLRSAGFYAEWKAKYGDQAWELLEKAVGKLS